MREEEEEEDILLETKRSTKELSKLIAQRNNDVMKK
jgi:hypothetical protein